MELFGLIFIFSLIMGLYCTFLFVVALGIAWVLYRIIKAWAYFVGTLLKLVRQ